MSTSDDDQDRTARSSVFALRMKPDELETLERAADQARESAARYVRKAIAMREQGMPVVPILNVSVGTPNMQTDQWASWTEAPQAVVVETSTKLAEHPLERTKEADAK